MTLVPVWGWVVVVVCVGEEGYGCLCRYFVAEDKWATGYRYFPIQHRKTYLLQNVYFVY